MADATSKKRRRSGARSRLSISDGELGALLQLATAAVDDWLFSDIPIGPKPPSTGLPWEKDQFRISDAFNGVTLTSYRRLLVRRGSKLNLPSPESLSRGDSEDEESFGSESPDKQIISGFRASSSGPQEGNATHVPPSLPAGPQAVRGNGSHSAGPGYFLGGEWTEIGNGSPRADTGAAPDDFRLDSPKGHSGADRGGMRGEEVGDSNARSSNGSGGLGAYAGGKSEPVETPTSSPARPASTASQPGLSIGSDSGRPGPAPAYSRSDTGPPPSSSTLEQEYAQEQDSPNLGSPGKGTIDRPQEKSADYDGSPRASGAGAVVGASAGGSAQGAVGLPRRSKPGSSSSPGSGSSSGSGSRLKVEFRSVSERARWASSSAQVDEALGLAQAVDRHAPHGKVPSSVPRGRYPALTRLLSDLKSRMKQALRAADEAFEARHGRKPQREEKEPLRPLYQRYRDVKVAITELEKRLVAGAGAVAGAGGSAGSSARGSGSGSRGSARSGGRSGGQQSSPRGAGAAKGTGGAGAGGGGTPLVPGSPEVEALLLEKRALQLRLRAFEAKFRAEHGRAVRFHRDIAPVSEQYARYKRVKELLRAAGVLPPASGSSSKDATGGGS